MILLQIVLGKCINVLVMLAVSMLPSNHDSKIFHTYSWQYCLYSLSLQGRMDYNHCRRATNSKRGGQWSWYICCVNDEGCNYCRRYAKRNIKKQLALTITFKITDKWWFSTDSGNGVEVPSIFIVTGKSTHIHKLIKTFYKHWTVV